MRSWPWRHNMSFYDGNQMKGSPGRFGSQYTIPSGWCQTLKKAGPSTPLASLRSSRDDRVVRFLPWCHFPRICHHPVCIQPLPEQLTR